MRSRRPSIATVDPRPDGASNPLGPMNIVRTALVSAGLVLIVYYCAVPNEPRPDDPVEVGLDRTYTVTGVDPIDGEYSGVADIRRQSDGSYEVQWIVTGGIQRGIGRLSGTRFEAEWEDVADADESRTGSAVYDVLGDGRLVGNRTVDGSDRVGTEELVPDQ